MTQHTKTPWESCKAEGGDYWILDEHRLLIATIDASEYIGEERTLIEANAEHIVKCVNSHDKLVEALEAVKRDRHDDWSPQYKQIQEALAEDK